MTTIAEGALVSADQINQWCPPGMLAPFAGATPPGGWLLCNGASYLRTDYPDLFAAIGTTYGAADGTHFNVPDLRGRVIVGYAAAGGHADVSTVGANDGQAATNRRPKHRTSLNDPGHPHGFTGDGTNSGTGTHRRAWIPLTDGGDSRGPDNQAVNSATTGITVGTGNANDALDAPSYIVIPYIIRAHDA